MIALRQVRSAAFPWACHDRLGRWVRTFFLSSLAVITAIVLHPSIGTAQIPGLEATVPAEETVQADPFGRDTPRGLVSGLVSAIAEDDRERAVRYLTLSEDRPEVLRPLEKARLEAALDLGGRLLSAADLSLAPEGASGDGLDPDIDRVGSLVTGDGERPLLARRGPDGSDAPVWRMDAATTAALLAFDGSAIARGALPRTWLSALPEGPDLAGAPTRDWLALFALAAAGYLVAWVLTGLRALAARRVSSANGPARLSRFVAVSGPPLQLGLAALFFTWGAGWLGVSVVARYQLGWIANLAIWLAVAWFLWRATDAAAGAILEGMSRRGQVTAYSAVTFFARVVKAILVLVLAAAGLRALGVDITAGIAALGVGGLALALGAQNLMANLIGSFTLIADRPVRVGDFCRFGTTLGTIEEIGIRSTRVRTLNRTIVTIPNGEFSNLHLENFTHRDRFLFQHVAGLIYATDPRTMRQILAAFRTLLEDHPRITPDTARVRLIRLGAYSKDVELFAYVEAADWNEYLEIQEGLILALMDIVESSASGFAFPTQTIDLGSGHARQLSREAA